MKSSQKLYSLFRKFSSKTADAAGSPWAFTGAVGIIVLWAALGPASNYSEDWQLYINTGTTIVTFLMVFLLQNAQSHDTRAINLKLDEIIRAIENARDGLVDAEDMSDEEMDRLHKEFLEIKTKYEKAKRALEDKSIRDDSQRT